MENCSAGTRGEGGAAATERRREGKETPRGSGKRFPRGKGLGRDRGKGCEGGGGGAGEETGEEEKEGKGRREREGGGRGGRGGRPAEGSGGGAERPEVREPPGGAGEERARPSPARLGSARLCSSQASPDAPLPPLPAAQRGQHRAGRAAQRGGTRPGAESGERSRERSQPAAPRWVPGRSERRSGGGWSPGPRGGRPARPLRALHGRGSGRAGSGDGPGRGRGAPPAPRAQPLSPGRTGAGTIGRFCKAFFLPPRPESAEIVLLFFFVVGVVFFFLLEFFLYPPRPTSVVWIFWVTAKKSFGVVLDWVWFLFSFFFFCSFLLPLN